MLRSVLIFLAYALGLHLLTFQVNFASVFLVYFLWQQFHYARQNLGVALWGSKNRRSDAIDQMFYLSTALLMVLGVFSDGPLEFFSYSISLPFGMGVSRWLPRLGIPALLGLYLVMRPRKDGRDKAIEHAMIFLMACFGSGTFASAWLCLNVYHNLQYLKFMRDFEKSLRFLVLPVLLAVSLFCLERVGWVPAVIFLALNFTHYTLDAIIWKRQPIEV